MTIQEMMDKTGAALLTPNADKSREIAVGYACDMLSWVMAHAAADMAWITVQSHMNVIAVATMMDMSAVILPEGIQAGEDIIAKAAEEGLALLASPKTAYELCGILYASGVPAKG